MSKQIIIFYFLLLFVMVAVAYYVGFQWDVLAFAGAVSRVSRELISGVGAKDVIYPGSTNTSSTTGTTTV